MTENNTFITVPADHFGDHLSHLSGCRGVNTTVLNDHDRLRLPSLNPNHFFSEENYRCLSRWWNYGGNEPLYISGPAGSGKTSGVEQFCTRLGIPVVSVMARRRMDRRELLGHWSVKDGATIWVDGPASLAWRHGYVLLINEFAAAPADMWVSCNDILERSSLQIGATGEVIAPRPTTRVVVTDNSRGHAEVSSDYVGRQIQDLSVIDRFWHMRMQGLSEDDEAKLLLAGISPEQAAQFHASTLEHVALKLAKAGADSRAQAGTKTLGFAPNNLALSHRTLRRLFRIMRSKAMDHPNMSQTPTEDLLDSIQTALTSALDEQQREYIQSLLITTLGNIQQDLMNSHHRILLSLTNGEA